MFPSWLDKKLETVFLVTLHGEWSLHDGLCQPGGNSRRALGRLRIIVANNSTGALAGATAAPPAPARVAAAAAGPPSEDAAHPDHAARTRRLLRARPRAGQREAGPAAQLVPLRAAGGGGAADAALSGP
jgi:hypothetical protein